MKLIKQLAKVKNQCGKRQLTSRSNFDRKDTSQGCDSKQRNDVATKLENGTKYKSLNSKETNKLGKIILKVGLAERARDGWMRAGKCGGWSTLIARENFKFTSKHRKD